MTHLLAVLADSGMQAVLIALGSLLIGGLALAAWRLRHDDLDAHIADALALGNSGRHLATGDLPADMRMENDR